MTEVPPVPRFQGPSIFSFEEFLPRSRALMRAGEKSGDGGNEVTHYNKDEGKWTQKERKGTALRSGGYN